MTYNFTSYDLVVGLGRSGVSMARYLKYRGRNVIATDIDPSKTDEATALEALGIPTQIGTHDQRLFDQADRIVPSPGIPLTLSYIQNARAKGVPLTGELDIFCHDNITPVISVTGSNGKTTTTRLIAEMAQASGLSCFVGGNIGIPLVEYLMTGTRTDLVVAEVSSFQLDLAQTFTPQVGILLNISPDHLDRYPDYKAYQDAKWRLFANQNEACTAVVNDAIEHFSARTATLSAQVSPFSPQTTAAATDITLDVKGNQITIPATVFKHLPGGHNKENIMAAALAVLAAGGTEAGICKGLDAFTPLAHRIQFIREINGVTFYNDSKATNTDAVIRAIQAFDAPITLILGGREKGTDFTELIPFLDHVTSIMALGEAATHIQAVLGPMVSVTPCRSMYQAVNQSLTTATPGDIVLLSPACASYDMYNNYEERGTDFIQCVNRIAMEDSHA